MKVIRNLKRILVFVERLTGFVILVGLQSKTSNLILRVLKELVVGHFGYLGVVHTDNEVSFLAGAFSDYLDIHGIELGTSAPYSKY